MRKTILILSLAFASLLISGCEEEKSASIQESGVHFQGRDCLSCHNKDLGYDSHLSVAGTLFRAPNSNKNDLDEACNEILHLELHKNSNILYNTKNYNDVSDPGFKGRGNFFALLSEMNITAGNYEIKIRNDEGKVLAETAFESHRFSNGFDVDNPVDFSNRHSCNSCHQENQFNGTEGLIYANVSACK